MNRIIIDREKLEHNIHVIKERINASEHKPVIIAVIKGNAYGMGSLLFARKLLDFNIDFFAVSEISEAKKLRENGFSNKILLLESTCIEQEIEDIIELDLIASLGSIEAIKLLDTKAKLKDKVVQAHLKIDTGFSRFGFVIDEEIVVHLKDAILNASNIKLTGTYSHFSESYSNDSNVTKKQFDTFMKNIQLLKENKIDTGMLHICNSSAFFKYPKMYLDAVRIGSAFTGRLQIKEATGLLRVGYLESDICEIRTLKKGSKIGYSGTCKLDRDCKVAIINAGYEAGVGVSGPKDSARIIDKVRMIKNAIKNLGKDGRMYVKIQNKLCPVLGRIGMKNMVVDITCVSAGVGDKVEIPINLIFANTNLERQEL